jgi:type I restriction enzyme M protein
LLDADAKQRIDRVRSALAAKIPDPKSQIEQITIALIYKFRDQSSSGPNKRSDALGLGDHTCAPCDWTELLRPRLDHAQRLKLYSAGLRNMAEDPDVPPEIRKILGDSQISLQDPHTLTIFLESMDEFKHDHLEQIGDTFEYLISRSGSQGPGGQFQTPRHIREFIVSTLDPKPNEIILDPACGTAGFLISAYRYIGRGGNTGTDKQLPRRGQEGFRNQFWGFDISPEMVRLSSVNMILHGFRKPQIIERDVLSEACNQRFDIILSNPPFLALRRGITSHSQFTVAARRTELLFLQFIATHLSDAGRAAVVVPDGLLFQNRDACREVRRMLVDGPLVAVVSLPAGCFNPYSEAKTCILFLDKRLARKSQPIAFFRADNDGFELGRRRTRIDLDDLPQLKKEIGQYFAAIGDSVPLNRIRFSHGQILSKTGIRSDGKFTLTHPRYFEIHHRAKAFPRVPLGELVEFLDYRRRPIRKADRKRGPYAYYGATGLVDHIDRYLFDEPLVLVGEDGAKWGAGEHTAYRATGKYWVNNHAHILKPRRDLLLDHYLEAILNQSDLAPYVGGVTVPKLNQEKLRSVQIPLPTIDQQRGMIKEIARYEGAIKQARHSIAELEHKIRRVSMQALNS